MFPDKIDQNFVADFFRLFDQTEAAGLLLCVCVCLCVCYNAFYYQNLYFTQIYSEAFFTQIYSETAKLASIIKHAGQARYNVNIRFYSFVNTLLYDLDLIIRKRSSKPSILLKIIPIDY